jgi:hypothetical protein
MFNHPFINCPAEYEEYVAACEAFADAADQLPDPPEEIFLDDSHLDGHWTDYSDEGGEDRYLDSYWEDQAEYGMEGCCGDF